jgi:hypothetical protein
MYDKKQFYRFKNKSNNPTLYSLFKISKALGIRPKELLDFEIKEKIEIRIITSSRKINR